MPSSRRVVRSGRQPFCAAVTRVFAGTLALLLALHMPGLQAEVVISTLPNTNLGGSTVSDTAWKAMLFTTGSSPTQLDSVVVGLNPNPTTESTPFTQQVKVSLFSVSGGNPNAELLTTGLVSVTMPARQGVYTFDASSFTVPFTMAANTPYALVLSSDSSTIKWGGNGVSSTTPTASAGFAYNTFLQSSDAGVSWATSLATNNAFAIVVVPEPSQLALLAMGAVGSWWAFRGRGRRRGRRRDGRRDGRHSTSAPVPGVPVLNVCRHWQLVGRHLNRFAVVMRLDEFAPVGGRATSGRHRWWLERFGIESLDPGDNVLV